MVNTYYQPQELLDVDNTYQCCLAMNHHNICESKDTEYYTRCVQRFRTLLEEPQHKIIYIHICPLIRVETYRDTMENLHQEILDFDIFLYERTERKTVGIFFIMIRDDDGIYTEDPENSRGKLIFHSEFTGSKVYIVYTNRNFIDAGETFMGNCHEEKTFIENMIKINISSMET